MLKSTWEIEKDLKRTFIKEWVEPMYKALNPSIEKLEYAVTEYNIEYLLVYYEHGYIKKLNITANSMAAIVADTVYKV